MFRSCGVLSPSTSDSLVCVVPFLSAPMLQLFCSFLVELAAREFS